MARRAFCLDPRFHRAIIRANVRHTPTRCRFESNGNDMGRLLITFSQVFSRSLRKISYLPLTARLRSPALSKQGSILVVILEEKMFSSVLTQGARSSQISHLAGLKEVGPVSRCGAAEKAKSSSVSDSGIYARLARDAKCSGSSYHHQ